MNPRSLGFATDLAVLARQGATVEERDGRTVVRMPANPGFRWGNFLLVPGADDPERLAALHAAAFPDADFVAIGVDDPDPTVDEAAWTVAGFEVERNTVLTAQAVAATATDRPVRAIQDERGWGRVAAIACEDLDEPDSAAVRDFAHRRVVGYRRAVDDGRAAWFGVEVDGDVVASAGIVDAGHGSARYQEVITAVAHRRRGYAAALIGALAALAADRFGARRLVLVADPEGPAIGLYRRLGFADTEVQVQLERRGSGVGDDA